MSSLAPHHPAIRSLRHTIVLTLEVMALVLALITLAGLLLVGRLMMGPVSTASLTPWIESALSQPSFGITAKITQAMLTWDKDQRRAVLDLNNIQFVDALEQPVANIPQILVVLHPLGYFDDAHSPWTVAVRRPHLHVRVDKDGKAHLGALSSGIKALETEVPAPAPKEKEDALNMASVESVLKEIIRSPRGASAGLGLFANLSIEELGVTMIDEQKQITWNVNAPSVTLKRIKSDYAGKAKIIIQKADMQTPLDFTLNYSAKNDDFTAAWSFDHLNPAVFAEYVSELKVLDYIAAPITGTIMVHFDENLHVFDGALNLNLDKGELRIADVYDAPLSFTSGQAAARYDAKTKTVSIEPVRLDFDKNFSLQAKASVDVSSDARDVKARFIIEKLAVEKLPLYWPESAGKNARDWILPHVKGGFVDEVVLNLGLSVPMHDIAAATLKDVNGTIKISGTQFTYWDPLPPLNKVAAEATFTDKGFDIKVLSGETGNIKLAPSPMTITGLDEIDQILTIEAHLKGPAQEVLTILDMPPLGYGKKMGIAPKDVAGLTDSVLKTSFPLLKALTFEQMTIDATSKVTDGHIKKVADLLAVSDGNGTLHVTTKQLSFNASAKLNDVPADVEWLERFAPAANETASLGKIKAKGYAQDAAKFGVALDATSSAAMPVDIVYERYPALSKLHIKANASNVQLDIPDLSFTKAADVEAQLEVALEWGDGKPMRLPLLAFIGKNINVKGQGAFDSAQKLQSLSINPLHLDATRAKVDVARGKDGAMLVNVSGDVLDLRRLLSGTGQQKPAKTIEKPKEKSPLQINANIGRVLTGATSALENLSVKGRRDQFGWAELNINAKGVKGTPLNVNLGPKDGVTHVAITTPDFGNILRALDVTDTLDGGILNIDGKSEPGDYTRTLFGHIKLEKYNVRNMPALAQLISAISPDGLAAMLTGNGLAFGDLTGEYVLNNDAIVITKASTTTGSLGLTTAGKYDLNSSHLQLEGQVIPVNFLNQIIGSIPLIGDILTGGEGGGIFSATYRVEGPISKAKISVNPVSVLAPGILRTILFTDQNITGEKPASNKTKP